MMISEVLPKVLNELKLGISPKNTRTYSTASRIKYEEHYRVRLSNMEALRIEEIEAERKKCEKCEGIAQCQFNESSRGFTPVIKTSEICGMRDIHFAVAECRHLKSWKQQQRNNRLFFQSKIPRAYEGQDFSAYKQRRGNLKALAGGMRAASAGNSLYIWGQGRRIGKTMLACIIGNEVLKRGKEALFSTVPELMISLRYNNEEYQSALNAARESEVLILDDIGAERATEYGGEQLYIILDYRLREGLQTIMTSNYAIEELRKYYGTNGNRIVDRIKQMSEIEEIK